MVTLRSLLEVFSRVPCKRRLLARRQECLLGSEQTRLARRNAFRRPVISTTQGSTVHAKEGQTVKFTISMTFHKRTDIFFEKKKKHCSREF